MNYQEMKYKRLICVLTIMDMEVYLGMLESYVEVEKQKSQKSQKSVYNKQKMNILDISEVSL